MCIAAISKQGGYPSALLKQFFLSNPHGGSYMYAEGGKIIVHRHIMNSEAYVATGEALKDKPNLMTHCRYRTQGWGDEGNSHPFMLNKGKCAMMHNGNLFQAVSMAKSDTREFAEEFDWLGDEKLMTPKAIARVSAIVGNYNKLVLLYDSGDYKIINENTGRWVKDNYWFSVGGFDNHHSLKTPTEKLN